MYIKCVRYLQMFCDVLRDLREAVLNVSWRDSDSYYPYAANRVVKQSLACDLHGGALSVKCYRLSNFLSLSMCHP